MGVRKPSVVVLTTLYPNSVQSRHGIFVEERLRSLVATAAVSARVIAPVPWFPFKHSCFGHYADFAAVPGRERRHGVEVLHPRYPVIPKVGMTLAPILMATCVMPVLKRMLAEGCDFDVIDAHYFYPDGVAAAMMGRRLNKPVVITGRGSDINVFPEFHTPRKQIVNAARQAAAVNTVSRALKSRLVDLGVDDDKVTTLRNGVDLARFAPVPRENARAGLELSSIGRAGQVWLSVGNLIELKGVHIAIEALARVPDAILMVAGRGPDEPKLRSLANHYGVDQRVCFLGLVQHDDLPRYFNAADVLVVPSQSEGMPNVVLEAMACGTPVVATAVGGIPELLTVPEAGRLMAERSVEALIEAMTELMDDYPDRQATRAHAQYFGWTSTTNGQLDIFRRIVADKDTDSTVGRPESGRQ